jgi:hypothetical protein
MGVIIPAAIGAASGIYKFVSGIKNTKEAKRLEKMQRPKYDIPQSEFDAYRMLGAKANQGLAAGSKQILQENADRGFSSGISAVLQGGGNPGDVAKLYDSYMGGINQMTLANDAAQVSNFNNFVNANYRMSNFTDKKWMINDYGPWADSQKKAAQLRSLGEGQKAAGIDTFASSLMGAFGNAGKGGGGGQQGGGGGGEGGGGEAARMAPDSGGNGGASPSWYPPMAPQQQQGGSGSPSWFAPMAPQQQSQDYYGMDVSKMKPSDAQMLEQLLYGK